MQVNLRAFEKQLQTKPNITSLKHTDLVKKLSRYIVIHKRTDQYDTS